MTVDHCLAVDPTVDILQRRWTVRLFDAKRIGAVANRDLAGLFCSEDQGAITVFTKIKLFTTIHHVNRILVGQAQCIFDSGITGSDHDNGLVLELIRVCQGVLNTRQTFPWGPEFTDVALESDAQNHCLGGHHTLVFTGDGEDPGLRGFNNRFDALAVGDIDLLHTEFGIPGRKQEFALTRREAHVAAQRKDPRLGHHMLAFLILKNRIGCVLFSLEQHMAQPQRLGTRGGGQPSRPRAHDDDVIVSRTASDRGFGRGARLGHDYFAWAGIRARIAATSVKNCSPRNLSSLASALRILVKRWVTGPEAANPPCLMSDDVKLEIEK